MQFQIIVCAQRVIYLWLKLKSILNNNKNNNNNYYYYYEGIKVGVHEMKGKCYAPEVKSRPRNANFKNQ